MIPKIIFKYSSIYDEMHGRREGIKNYPSEVEILNYIKKVEKLWKKGEKKVLKELSKITGLQWQEKQIYCYVIGRCVPFSDPLTLPVYRRDREQFIDTLVHELIHCLLGQEGNYERAKKAWQYIHRQYSNEGERTRIHIPLYAIHAHVLLKFYGEKRLEQEIARTKHFTWDSKSYQRAWEIIQKEGYKKIIEKFRKKIEK